ncbi:SPFH domain-containing protein [Methylomonas sp. UP202]|uniref:SPFH domain-containing protein n=1 Tax=Methylomonas sp. UP202 TaxID=3040943 RepID=UPI002479E0E6|nr:SPFH domain-containing protein [Methylomonas sp. UP202]WGS88597.1 SPFH domain-containing protein [Methylomonas sp. UP202]
MLGIQYFKADSSTFVIKTVNGKVRKKGKGLSFFYNAATASIAAVPVSAQEAPFIFKLLTADFQSVTVQGQVTYRVAEPESMAEMLNYSLKNDGLTYVSEDPLKLSDRVIRIVQSIVQNKVQVTGLRDALKLGQTLVVILREQLAEDSPLTALGIVLLDVSISAVQPTPETARALEAEAREAILKEADDAIYDRRKSAVEQERTIKEAELQTELSVQQKEQEIAESRILNERTIQRGKVETERERLQAEIAAETQRKELVALNSENSRQQADAEAYAIAERMKAFRELPVENLRAMALAKMEPEQLMAMAFESLAQNAGNIGELTITPDLFGQMMKKSVRP